MRVLDAIGHALAVAGSMTWQVTWSLILGFTLSAVVQAVIRRQTVARLLGDGRPRTLALATGLGAASSSCSYAAVALARALIRRGASFTAAMAFEIASTNLVIELGIILALLLSWQFTLAEFTGGPIMIVLMAVAFRLFVRQRLIQTAREQASKGLAGSMEGHAAMDMSIASGGSLRRRLGSREGYTSVSHIFVMEWAAVVRDIALGLLIAGAVGAWVPDSFWQHLFLTGHPLAARLWGPLIGPVISVLSFVCSIGNVPLAAVLWNGGISFGGVVAFIFADLIIIPILVIYRKYYSTKMMLAILGIFYATMVAAGYIVEFTFGGLGLIPATRAATVAATGITWNYTTVLNIIFLLLAAALLVRFFRSGAGPMLKMMGGSPAGPVHDQPARHDSRTAARLAAGNPVVGPGARGCPASSNRVSIRCVQDVGAGPKPPPVQRRRGSRRVMVSVVAAGLVFAAAVAVAVTALHPHQSQPAALRVSGIPAGVSTSLANLMGLSPVPGQTAPGFTLTDQSGHAFSLASFKGRAVVLEFMDPHCTDICPIVSKEFVDAYHDLGSAASLVVFIAVNINAYHHGVADVAAFTREQQLNTIPSWHFLTGPVSSLQAVWNAYQVYVQAPSPNADIVHTSVVYFIDPSGRERFAASPMADHTSNGTAYLPLAQQADWGHGIALIARQLAP
jgi:uncharacterized membrane protein YraQ (UPF0718 family)/cytochrome oxidase Cu insertion factor (SCO1/SenC/PrrC family)